MMALISRSDLIGVLGVSDAVVDGWVAEGLPSRDGKFDEDEVGQWLVENGKAAGAGVPVESPVESPGVLRTKGEVAQFFEVAVRTVGEWLNDPAFPGKSGSPGKRDGFFPIKEMVDWKKDREASAQPNQHGAVDTTRQELQKVKLAEARLKLERAQGVTVDLGLVLQVVQYANDIARQQLRAIPELVIKSLPASVDSRVAGQVRTEVERIVNRSCVAIADIIEKGFSDDE